MREANQEIERERHTMPTLQDSKEENGAKFVSKIDLKQAYHQLELHPDSRFITTFSIHEGLFQYKRFLGMANTCHEYIPDYATITAPLRQLTKKNIAFKWENRHQKAFEQLKKKLTSTPVMAYFDTKKRSLVIVDGSPYGISAILAQKEHHSQQYKILSYASRALSPVETRYSQTDIEGLSLVWGIEHFRMFLIGSEFDVITDHNALESTVNNQDPDNQPASRDG